MNQAANVTVNLGNITWKIKSLDVDLPAKVSNELTYETKVDMQFGDNLSTLALALHVTVLDAKIKGNPLAKLVLGLQCNVSGLERFIQGTQANIPMEFAHHLVVMMTNTARGILMQASRGSALELHPLPPFGPEQLSTMRPASNMIN